MLVHKPLFLKDTFSSMVLSAPVITCGFSLKVNGFRNPIYDTLKTEMTAWFEDVLVEVPTTIISGDHDEPWPVESNGQVIYNSLIKNQRNEEMVRFYTVTGGHAMHSPFDVYSSEQKTDMGEHADTLVDCLMAVRGSDNPEIQKILDVVADGKTKAKSTMEKHFELVVDGFSRSLPAPAA